MDFLAGTFAGIMQAIICHPLDTMKTVRQANKNIIWHPKFMYRGLSVPILSNGVISTVTYGTYYYAKENGFSFVSSSLMAGVSAGLVCGPVELYKISLQIPNKTKFRPTLGLGLSILRETPSMIIYYKAYETCEQKQIHPAFGGAIAGTCSWLSMFHIDVIKTRIQSGQAKTIVNAVKMGQLNNGLGYCLLRAAPHNAIGFWAFHWFKENI